MYITQFITPPEQFKSCVYEGLDIELISNEIVTRRLDILFKLVDKDFVNAEGEYFSQEIVYEIKSLIGELVYEISEALKGGIVDFEKIFRF